ERQTSARSRSRATLLPAILLAGTLGNGLAVRLVCFALTVGCCLPHYGQTPMYTFTTIAGSTNVIGSADGTNQAALFNYPTEIAMDQAGIIYVSDLLNHTIRQVAPVGTNWVVTTLAGMPGVHGTADGTNSDARFYHPNGI